MPRPFDMPPAERFEHGTRSRYVTGCRCARCREATRLVAKERSEKLRAAAAEALPNLGVAPTSLVGLGVAHRGLSCEPLLGPLEQEFAEAEKRAMQAENASYTRRFRLAELLELLGGAR